MRIFIYEIGLNPNRHLSLTVTRGLMTAVRSLRDVVPRVAGSATKPSS